MKEMGFPNHVMTTVKRLYADITVQTESAGAGSRTPTTINQTKNYGYDTIPLQIVKNKQHEILLQ
jgi:hypothetical protein